VEFLDSNISFGRPGVEFYGQHSVESGENAVTKIVALPNEVRFDALIMIVFTLNKVIFKIDFLSHYSMNYFLYIKN